MKMNDKQMPVNAESVKNEDVFFDSKKHISHFSDCPKANSFRKPVVKHSFTSEKEQVK